MSDIPYKPELIEAVKELALEVKSNYYLDCRNLNLTPWGLNVVVRTLWLEMTAAAKFDAFGGPSIGADPIIGGLCMWANLFPAGNRVRGFLVRSEAKEHGKGGRIVGPLRAGDRCVLVEDVVFTGASSLEAVDQIEAFGAKVVQAFCIVDRLQGGAQKFADRGIPFKSLLDLTDLGLV